MDKYDIEDYEFSVVMYILRIDNQVKYIYGCSFQNNKYNLKLFLEKRWMLLIPKAYIQNQ